MAYHERRLTGLVLIGLVMRRATAAAAAIFLGACSNIQELRSSGEIGAGVVARTLCTAIFLQGRDLAVVRGDELGPLWDPRLAEFSVDINHARGEVRSSWRGLFGATAGYKPGVGCAIGRAGLAPDRPLHPTFDQRPWPAGDAPAPSPDVDAAALAAVADWVFTPAPGPLDPRARSLVVVHDGELVFERHAPGFDGRLPQYGASMSKTVTAALAGILIGEGRLSLTDDRLAPDWRDGRAAITVADLLHMESGLDFNEDYGGAADPGRMLYASRSASAFAAGRGLAAPPGTRFSYSSGDTNILMAVMRAQSGRDTEAWAAFPQESLFAPLGMRSAVFEQDAGGDFIGSTFVYASALDWARFGLLLADDGVRDGRRILPEGWVGVMTAPTTLSNGVYGAQTWLRGGRPGGEAAPLIELSGFGGQMVLVHPPTRTVIVRLGFNPNPQAFDRTEFIRRVLTALEIEPPARLAR